MEPTTIRLVRAEGPSVECDRPVTLSSYREASDVLSQWACTAPKPGQGYDKCDFSVEWPDGQVYEGRVDLDRSHVFGYDLKTHIRDFIGFITGLVRPPWMSPEKWVKIKEAHRNRGSFSTEEQRDALKMYERVK